MTEKVSASRLAWGEWSSGKLTGEGDIHAAYSADAISEGRPVRQPFSWNGGRWITTGICGDVYNAYRLIPVGAFAGTPTSYAEKVAGDCGARARSDPQGFYHGMKVKHAGSWFVMIGPETEVAAGEEEQPALLQVTADPEYRTRIEAARVTAELQQKSARRADAGRRPIEESPLFGGPAQGVLF